MRCNRLSDDKLRPVRLSKVMKVALQSFTKIVGLVILRIMNLLERVVTLDLFMNGYSR